MTTSDLRYRALVACFLATACGGETTDPEPSGGDRLDGAPGDVAAAAIEWELYEPRAEDFSLGHPALPGLRLSHNTVIVEIAPAATVGDVNAMLDDLDAEIVGGLGSSARNASGLLVLRLPISSHPEMETLLSGLRGRPFVRRVVQDAELGPTEVTQPSTGTPGWRWDTSVRDTWGLTALRVPQVWNFNRSIRAAGQPAVVTGVLDGGFDTGHPDMPPIYAYVGVQNLNDHGTHVAGTIAARPANQVGIDGVTPFAALALRKYGNAVTTLGSVAWGLADFMIARPDMRVVNASLGYNWYQQSPALDPRSDASAQAFATQQGAVFAATLATLSSAGYTLPFIASAAGNDSRTFPTVDARFSSPIANAALVHGAAPIVVVEADSLVTGGAQPSYLKADFSNTGGHLSAPGSRIWSLVPGGYAAMSGTSMATPHISGVVSYLYALAPSLPAPTMTTNAMRDLLLANLQPADRNGRPQLDAYAAALALDAVLGGSAILRRLVDIDDGSQDGNLRVEASGSLHTSENLATDNGAVDMADFRRWRDWLLQTENPAGLSLDGDALHPKKDPNGDGAPGGTPAYESLYSRGDFNGDGKLDRTGTRAMPGALGGQALTDLQVLQHLFTDPNYLKAELPGLITSGDLHIDASSCLTVAGATAITSSVTVIPAASPARPPRAHSAQAPTTTYTVAPASYRLRIEARNAAGEVIRSAEHDAALALGGDVHWRPTACGAAAATITLGWGAGTEPLGAEARARLTQFGTGGQQCAKLVQPIPAPLSSPETVCQLAGGFTGGQWNATVTGGGSAPLVINVTGAGRGDVTPTELDRWSGAGSSFFLVFFTVSGGDVQYSLSGNAQITGHRGTDWPATALVELQKEGGGLDVSVANGCSATGCNPESPALNRTGTLSPGKYVISGSATTGSGNFQNAAKAVTATYSYQLTVTP